MDISLKKGQAALEFLVTYGWAFLIILIAIGALAYFGILSPKNLLPSRCSFGSEFGCKDYLMSVNGIDLMLTNNAGEPIIIDSVNLSAGTTQLSDCTSSAIGAVWKSGAAKNIVISCGFTGEGLMRDSKEKIDIKLTYHKASSSSSFSKLVEGSVYTTIKSNQFINTILQNPGFEAGSLSGWNNWAGGTAGATTAFAKSGAYSAIISGSNSYCNNYYVQDIPVAQNTLYSLTGWVKTVGEVGASGVGIANTSWASWQNSALITGTTDWTFVQVSNYNSGKNTFLMFFATVQWCGGALPGSGPSGTSYFDDLRAVKSS
ncbi:MAG: carbohydrate binding domain-containing protein [Nanoarchaeota archaeon]